MALTQSQYRFGSDTGTNETDHGWLAAQNTAINVGNGPGNDVALDTVFLLRIGYQNDANAVTNQNFTVQYKINAGSWVTIGTATAGVDAEAATVLTNNGNTTQRLTGLSGTFQGATGQAEDGDAGGNSMDIAASGNAEAVFSIKVNSAGVTAGDIITFQSLAEGSTISYSVTPTLYVANTLSGATLTGNAPTTGHTITTGAVTLALATIATTVQLFAGTVALESAMTVELREGTTLRATREVTLAASYATSEFALTTEERDAITDWANLRVYFTADVAQAEVSWVELETPAATEELALTGAYLTAGSSLNAATVSPGSVTLTGDTLASGEALNAPTAAAVYAVTGATIAAGSAVQDGHVVAPGAVTLIGATIGTGETLNAPTAAAVYAVTGATLASGSAVQDGHAITVGAVTLEGATIAAGSTAAEGHIVANAGGGIQYLGGATIASGSQLYAGTVAPGAVTLTGATIATGQALNAPTLAAVYAVTGATLAAGSAVQDGHTVAPGAVTLIGATLASGSTVQDGHVVATNAVTLYPPALAAGSSLTAPTIPTLTVLLLEGETTRATRYIFAPASQTTSEFALTTDERNAIAVWSNLRLSLTADGQQVEVAWAELETPAATSVPTLIGTTIASGSQLYAATVTGGLLTLEPPAIAAGTTLYGATVSGGFSGVTLDLYEGATLRATRVVTFTTALATHTFDLTAEEFAAITDWTNLRVALTATVEQPTVTWLALEAPDHTVTATPISSGSELFAPSLHQYSLGVLLYEGDTLRATLSAGLTETLTDRELVLTTEQRESITDWANLRVALVADTDQARVSWVQLRTPEPGALVLPTIASTVQFYGATIGGVTVTLYQDEFLGPTATVYAPAVVTGLVTPFLDTTATVNAPTLAMAVQAPTISAGSVINAPSLTVGAVTLEPPTIPVGTALYGGTVTNSGSLAVAFLPSEAALFGGTMTTGAVTLIGATIPTGETFSAPTVTLGAVTLEPPAIASTSELFGGTLSTTVSLVGATIASTSQLYPPTALPATVRMRPPTISTAAVLFAPSIIAGQTLSLPFHAGGAVLYGGFLYFPGSTVTPTPGRTYTPKREQRTYIPKAEGRRFIPNVERRTYEVTT